MNSTPYTGKVSGMKTSPWLASEDLLGVGTVKVKIAAVVQNNDVEMEGGRKEACLFSLAFNGIPKQMILNATNRRTLSAAFGADTKQWLGAEIELYVQDGIRKPKPKDRRGNHIWPTDHALWIFSPSSDGSGTAALDADFKNRVPGGSSPPPLFSVPSTPIHQ